MKNRSPILLIASLFLVAGSLPSFYAAEKKSKPGAAFRAEFIRDFKRIGMNTTHEDALFLRILIQSREAKAGIS